MRARNIDSYARVTLSGTIGSVGSNAILTLTDSNQIIEGPIGSYATIYCKDGTKITGNIGSNVTIICEGAITVEGTVGSYTKITCGSGSFFTNSIGSNAFISCSGNAKFYKDIGSYSKILNANNLTFIGNIGSNGEISADGYAHFLGTIGSYIKISVKGDLRFEKTIGSNAEITSRQGKIIFEDTVGSYVAIRTNQTPIFQATVGSRTTLNGNPVNVNNRNNEESEETSSVVRIVNGRLFVNGREQGSVNTSRGVVINNTNSTGGSAVTDVSGMVFRGPVNIVTTSSSHRPQVQATDATHTATMSHSSHTRVMTSLSTTTPSTTSTTADSLNQYSSDMQSYVESFERKAKSNTEMLDELKLTDDEYEAFVECFDAISEKVTDIPVRLNGRLYDLDTVLKLTVDPFSKQQFHKREIQSARDIEEKIQKIYQTIQAKRTNSTNPTVGPPAESPQPVVAPAPATPSAPATTQRKKVDPAMAAALRSLASTMSNMNMHVTGIAEGAIVHGTVSNVSATGISISFGGDRYTSDDNDSDSENTKKYRS